MKLICQQKQLLEGLFTVQKAINPHNTLPILGNILLKAEGQKLYLTATNLEIAITTSLPAEVKNEGKITIPAKILVSYIGFLKEGEVEFAVEDGSTLAIKAQGSKTKLKGIAAEEFPPIPLVEKEESFTLETNTLKEAIEAIVFCCATSTTRPVLSGVYFWGKGSELRLVATDSYRLGEKIISLSEKTFSEELKSIVPARTMQEFARILAGTKEKEAEVIASKNQILFRVGLTELTSRLIEGKFPEYLQIIPTTSKTTALVSISELALGIKRVGLFARENNNNIRFLFAPKKVQITTDATEVGSEESEIEAEVEGEENQIALNGQYLLDILQTLSGEKAQVKIEGKLSPVVIFPEKPSGLTQVIMPLKV